MTQKISEAPPRLIAFYLPQYHPIPENDEWWGEGFTEWRNVSTAEPLFKGHYQPHIPAELGYYDLRDEETRVAQAELAKQYGIGGFCYYHYWFNGRRLLERPLTDVVESGRPDFPFCICWANENWTRRWDGEDRQILMRMEYSEEDDRAHIRSLIPVFEDQRYIRINGKPVFLVYRTENMPNPARTAEIWREEALKAGIGELYLCRVESIGTMDPQEINFDAAVEFAPDWKNKGPRLYAGADVFRGIDEDLQEICNDNFLHSYPLLVETMMAKELPDYTWYRCVTPAWDNRARMKKGANIYLGSTPEIYRDWLAGALDITAVCRGGNERLVFINAWNEWAEGNHLEPDQKFGHAYLEATRQAVVESQGLADTRRVEASDQQKMIEVMNRLARNEYQLNVLQRRVARRDEQLEELLASTSWRATLPLRVVKQRLLALKKFFAR